MKTFVYPTISAPPWTARKRSAQPYLLQKRHCRKPSGVYGTGGKLLRGGEFFCRESGSTLRFFLPLALCALSEISRANAASSGKADFPLFPATCERGIGIYEEALKNAASFEKITENGNGAITVSGTLLPGKYTIRGNVSSQFATGLLFSLPLLPENSELEILPPAESESYIAVTADVLKKFGVCIEKTAQKHMVYRRKSTFFFGNFPYGRRRIQRRVFKSAQCPRRQRHRNRTEQKQFAGR